MQKNDVLADAVRKGKLIAFADDILLIADDKEEAEKLIKSTESLQIHGLKLNKTKSSILSEHPDLKDID